MPKSKMYGFSNPFFPPLPLSIANGGTGATSAEEAREALGALSEADVQALLTPIVLPSAATDGSASTAWIGRRGSNVQVNAPTGGVLALSINGVTAGTIGNLGAGLRLASGSNSLVLEATRATIAQPLRLFAGAEPTQSSGADIIFVALDGSLKYKGETGTTTTLAPA